MRYVLRPARALLDRLSVLQRLAVIFGVLLLPLPILTLAFIETQQKQVDFSALERVGADYLTPVLPLATTLAEVRVTGDVAGAAALPALVDDVASIHEGVGGRLGVDDAYDAMTAAVAAVADAPEAELADRAGAALDQVLALVSAVGDRSNLILDPDLDSFYVMDTVVNAVPRLLDQTAEAVASTGSDRDVAVVLASAAAATITSNIDRAVAATGDPALATDLRDAVAALDQATADAFADGAPGADAGRAVLAATSALGERALPTLDRLLEHRIAGLDHRLHLTRVGAPAAFLLGLYLALAYYASTRETVRSLADRSKALARSSEGLSAVSMQLSGAAASTADEVHAVAESVQSVGIHIASAASGTHQMGAAIQEISSSTGGVATTAMEAVEWSRRASELMASLDDSARTIGDASTAIGRVTAQTQLLALNAAIESARAGEAGAGFAVVASEVKDLAAAAAEAANDIDVRIAAIQTHAETVREAIESISSLIDEVSDAQATVAAAVEQHSAASGEMSRTMDEVALRTDVIVGGLERVAVSTASASAGARETEEAARDLASLALQLDELVAALS